VKRIASGRKVADVGAVVMVTNASATETAVLPNGSWPFMAIDLRCIDDEGQLTEL
jgi:hypothetical protein